MHKVTCTLYACIAMLPKLHNFSLYSNFNNKYAV